jgi:glycosyltransferase involved in cell wall biosynthesis
MPEGVLFVHNGFPGQFKALAEALVARGVKCCAIGHHHSVDIDGVELARYALPRGSTPGIYPPAMAAEGDFLRAAMAFQVAVKLRDLGWDPAVIVGHAHWGETAFLKEVFPEARQALYPEYFSRGVGHASAFDPEFQPSGLQAMVLAKARSAVMALELSDADAIVCPTPYQASTIPDVFQPRVRLIHEGVDTYALRPGPGRPIGLRDGTLIDPAKPVITHINNHLEPLRGLHILARALPKVLAAVPEAQVLIMGQEDKAAGYTGETPDGRPWKEHSLKGVELDPARVHFLGWNDHAFMHEVLKTSWAHVYYTYPFVLSWSLAEAMALGCYVIGSDTAPLHDAIEDGVNGTLLPFFDVDALSDALIAACRDPQASAGMRVAARRTAEAKFSRAKGLAQWFDLLRELGLVIPRP